MLPLIVSLCVLVLGAVGSAASATVSYVLMHPMHVEDDEYLLGKFKKALRKTDCGKFILPALKSHVPFCAKMHIDPIYPNLVVVMLTCYDSELTAQLGRKFGLPISCPLIWDMATNKIRFGGSQPKTYTGDTLDSGQVSLSTFDCEHHETVLTASLKVRESELSNLMCVNKLPDGRYLLLVTSPDSACCATSILHPINHVIEFQKMWSIILDRNANLGVTFFQEMLTNQYTITAQMFTKKFYFSHNIKREIVNPITITVPWHGDGQQIVKLVSPAIFDEFLTRHGFWYTSCINIKSTMLPTFVNELVTRRDWMTFDLLRAICNKHQVTFGHRLSRRRMGSAMDAIDFYNILGATLNGIEINMPVWSVKPPTYIDFADPYDGDTPPEYSDDDDEPLAGSYPPSHTRQFYTNDETHDAAAASSATPFAYDKNAVGECDGCERACFCPDCHTCPDHASFT